MVGPFLNGERPGPSRARLAAVAFALVLLSVPLAPASSAETEINSAAPQQESSDSDVSPPQRLHRHGGAIPT